MNSILFVTGGARSGKSAYAERRVAAWPEPHCYIATAEAWDAEMADRIARHRDRRGSGWSTREAPLELVAALDATDGGGARLVDCLTLWLSNLLHAERDWAAEGRALAAALARQKSPVAVVTNEVGLGIVPENALARRFRDAAGLLNQWVADAASEAVLVVAGQALTLKAAPRTGGDAAG